MAVILRKRHTVDATGKAIGRVATEIAMLLMGKRKTDFTLHIDGGDFVLVENADQVSVTQKKMDQKEYHHYTGYPGGIRTKKLKQIMADRPERAIELAVARMLPRDKRRTDRLKRLTFTK